MLSTQEKRLMLIIFALMFLGALAKAYYYRGTFQRAEKRSIPSVPYPASSGVMSD